MKALIAKYQANFLKFRSKTLLVILLGVMAFGFKASIPPQGPEVPASLQYVLFTKIFTYDRNLESKISGSGDIIIGVVFQEAYRNSFNAKNDLLKAAGKSKIKEIRGHKIRFLPINVEGLNDLSGLPDLHPASMYYIAPLRAVDVSSITNASRELDILTLTGVPDYCKEGIAVGVEQRGEKAGIIINLAAAKAENCNFSSQLLKVARIIDE